LEGRWTKLAISAHTRGLLDYSNITRNKPRSLLREGIVLKEMENERYAELFSLKALLTALTVNDEGAASQANLSEFMSIQFPWLRVEKESGQESEVERLISAYKKLQELKQANESGINADADADADEAAR